ncbi:MAG: VWA domain-containing protein [Gemmataceae bacterium]
MAFGLLNAFLLAGLAAVAIPPIIHILSRRRYTVVEWGAMQFLELGETKQRRLLIEEILLMLLRMGLIAVLVLALAAPYITGPMVAQFATRPNRDVIVVIDGSASMNLRNRDTSTSESRAVQRVKELLEELSPKDKVGVILARTGPTRVLDLTSNKSQVRATLDSLRLDAGRCDAPKAFATAWNMLREDSQRQEKDLVILTDGHRVGWNDDKAVSQWKLLRERWEAEYKAKNKPAPRVWFINTRGDQEPDVANYTLHPLQSRERAWVNQAVRFQTTLSWSKSVQERPYQLRLYVDDQLIKSLPLPKKADWKRGKFDIQFWHTFESVGSHVVSVVVEPELPPKKRQDEYKERDRLTVDNRVDRAVLIQRALSVLLVDGDTKLSTTSGTFYLEPALQPRQSTASGVVVRTVTSNEFVPEDLERPIGKTPDSLPRVLVLSDVPSLNKVQRDSIEKFLAEGGGVWVILGSRVQDRKLYNQELYQDGRGWLPARLDKIAGDRKKPDLAASPDVNELLHPAMSMFRGKGQTGLREVRFPQWWKVTVANDPSARVMGFLDRGDPMCVERSYKKGRVVLNAVPMDRSWGATFPGTAEFPVFVHEVIHHLAGKGEWQSNLRPGEPITYHPTRWERLENAVQLETTAMLTPPNGKSEKVTIAEWPFRHKQTQRSGVYTLALDNQSPLHFVVGRDPQESRLNWMSAEETEALLHPFSAKTISEPEDFGQAVINNDHQEDIWWILMLGVIVLLCVEIALTRRLAAN